MKRRLQRKVYAFVALFVSRIKSMRNLPSGGATAAAANWKDKNRKKLALIILLHAIRQQVAHNIVAKVLKDSIGIWVVVGYC